MSNEGEAGPSSDVYTGMASEQLTERARSEATVDTGGSPVDAGAPSVATHGALGSVHQAAARLRGLSPHEREAEIGALQSQRGNAFTGNVLAALDDVTPLRAAWGTLAACALVVFVSPNAVRHFFDARPSRAAWPATTRAGSTGPGELPS